MVFDVSDLPFFRMGDAELACSSGALLLPGPVEFSGSMTMFSEDGGVIMRSSEPEVEAEESRSKRVGLGAGHQPGGVPATPSRAGP